MHELHCLLFIAFGISGGWNWVVLYRLLQRLNQEHAEALRAQGISDAWDLVSPTWRMQRKFVTYILCGGLRELNDPIATRQAHSVRVTLAVALATWAAGVVVVLLSE